MSKYKCKICSHIYDEEIEEVSEEKEEIVESLHIIVPEDFYSIQMDESKCVKCGSCKSICKYKQGVSGYYDSKNVICIECGQCGIAYSSGAIDYKSYKQLEKETVNS